LRKDKLVCAQYKFLVKMQRWGYNESHYTKKERLSMKSPSVRASALAPYALILLQNYSGRRRWLPLILCAAALLALELGILAVKYLFLSVFSGDGWSSPLLLVYSVFLLLLYFAWVALFAALLALLIYPILKKLRI